MSGGMDAGSPAVGVPTALLPVVGAQSPVAHGAVHPWPGSSPAQRFGLIARHSDLTPGIAAEAERYAGLEVKARVTQDSPLGDAARSLQTAVLGRLHGRKKKRVHASGKAAVAKAEQQIAAELSRQARKARKAMLRADSSPQALTGFAVSSSLKRADRAK